MPAMHPMRGLRASLKRNNRSGAKTFMAKPARHDRQIQLGRQHLEVSRGTNRSGLSTTDKVRRGLGRGSR